MNAPAMQSRVAGSGEPLVLVGGGVTGWLSWEPHAERLAATRRVFRLQLLNVQWGLEDRPLPEGYAVKTESAAIGAALDALGLERAVDIVGWSYGALASLGFALDHPERIRTLTLIEPPAWWVIRELGPLDAASREQETVLASMVGDISEEQLEQFASVAGLVPPGGSARALPQWPVWSRHRQALRHCPAVLAQRDQLERLERFTRPALLLKGTGSAPFLHRIIDSLGARMPDARVIELPAGHGPHIVSMDRFLEALAAFHDQAGQRT